MLSGDFYRKLQRCNPDLRVYCGNDDRKPAGLWYYVGGDYREICGVDKNYLPEYPVYDELGHIVRSGWRRVLQLLIAQGLIDRRRAETVFLTHFEPQRRVKGPVVAKDRIQAAVDEAMNRNFLRLGKPALTPDDAHDIANELRKKDGK